MDLRGPLHGGEGQQREGRKSTKQERGWIIPIPPIPGSTTAISNSGTHTRLTALCHFVRDYPGESVPERQNQSGFYWSKR